MPPDTKKSYIHQIRDAAFGVLLVYLMFIAVLGVTQRSMMYLPPASIPASHMTALEGYEKVSITTKDELALHAYFVPPKDSKKPILLLFHGNASHPAWEAFKTASLITQGYGVLLASYRGYDNNPGKPTEDGLFMDGQSYLDYLKESYPSNPVILYGESLGSGVAIEMAIRVQPLAVILEVPFLSAVDVAQRFYPYIPFIDKLLRDPYRNDHKISSVHAPTLFLLAGKDDVVSLGSGTKLYELANDPKKKVVFSEASHVNVYQYGAMEEMLNFLKKVVHE